MTLYMPEWDETGSLIEPIDGAEIPSIRTKLHF
jgi:hypothetical protein